MCGILGVINLDGKQNINKPKFRYLNNLLKHRGPDDSGILHEKEFSFGHRRLSIIDLSKKAKQPLYDHKKQVIITFNGEIYNFLKIKDELISKGHKFKSNSDTEVILEAYKEWGIKCVDRFNGMFAFGLYDKSKREFYLVRDRLGIKPVYYSKLNGKFIFCSELKGIINYPNFKKELNLEAVSCFLSFRHVLSNETYFKNVYQLEPGHYVKIKNNTESLHKYWDIDLDKLPKHLSKKKKQQFKNLIEDSITKCMISDVPLGAYLSGGLDSSIITTIMAKNSSEQIKTFTVKFKEKGFDETKYAKKVSKKINAKNIEINVSGKDYLKNMKKLIRYKDQPLGMHNEVALYLMAKKLKKYVTVVLSGEGADELFSGYGRLFRSPFDYKKIKLIEKLPRYFREFLIKRFNLDKKILGKTELEHFLMNYSYFPLEEKNQIYNDKMKKETKNDIKLFELFRSKFNKAKKRSYYDKISYTFEKLHLPGLLLLMDSTSMAASVEVRVPFVDHRVVQESFKLPLNYKLRWKSLKDFLKGLSKPSSELSENNDTTKYILRELFNKELPKEVLERKKMVFPVPLNSWFKNDFNEVIKKRTP